MGIMAPAEIEPHARPERDANDSETSKFLFREGILYFGKMRKRRSLGTFVHLSESLFPLTSSRALDIKIWPRFPFGS
jgi:hypothetical protein